MKSVVFRNLTTTIFGSKNFERITPVQDVIFLSRQMKHILPLEEVVSISQAQGDLF